MLKLDLTEMLSCLTETKYKTALSTPEGSVKQAETTKFTHHHLLNLLSLAC